MSSPRWIAMIWSMVAVSTATRVLLKLMPGTGRRRCCGGRSGAAATPACGCGCLCSRFRVGRQRVAVGTALAVGWRGTWQPEVADVLAPRPMPGPARHASGHASRAVARHEPCTASPVPIAQRRAKQRHLHSSGPTLLSRRPSAWLQALQMPVLGCGRQPERGIRQAAESTRSGAHNRAPGGRGSVGRRCRRGAHAH